MTQEKSSIDDVLAGAHLPPDEPNSATESAIEDESHLNNDKDDSVHDTSQSEPHEEFKTKTDKGEPEDKEDVKSESDTDEYGNETLKSESKTYTEDEVNERINKAVRERLSRLKENQGAPNQPPTQHQQQQAQDAGFEYDENSNDDWQQQLKQFIRQTNEEVQREHYQREQQQREQAAQAEFEDKFHTGMSRFSDFIDVVGVQPITDAMTVATRGMKDPAAFLYAASKRHAEDLKRIATLRDPYTQMVEMGRLEERMKKAKEMSKTPRPLGNTKEDTSVKSPENKIPTIEDLIAQNDARRLKNMRNRRG